MLTKHVRKFKDIFFKPLIVKYPILQNGNLKTRQSSRKHKISREDNIYCTHGLVNLNVLRYSMIKHSIMTSEMNNSGIINPPERVRGMTKLDKSAFQSIVKVPTLLVPVETLGIMKKKLKSLCLKMPNLNQIVELDKNDPRKKSHRLILLNPAMGKTFQEVNKASENVLSDNGLTESDFSEFEVNLEYENWSCSDVLHAVTQENVTGFSQIGHICHFNLKDYALPYKNLIGNSTNTNRK